jgi:hypothetical protein
MKTGLNNEQNGEAQSGVIAIKTVASCSEGMRSFDSTRSWLQQLRGEECGESVRAFLISACPMLRLWVLLTPRLAIGCKEITFNYCAPSRVQSHVYVSV